MTNSRDQHITENEFSKLSKIFLDCDFLEDPKIIELEAEFGASGIVAWQKLLTALAREHAAILSEKLCILLIKRRGIEDPEKLFQYLINSELLHYTDDSNSWVTHRRLMREQRETAARQKKWRDRRERHAARSGGVTQDARVSAEEEHEHEHEEEHEQEKEEGGMGETKPEPKVRGTSKTLENWKPPKDKTKIREFVYLKPEEHQKLKEAFEAQGLGEDWLERGFFKLDAWYRAKPKKRHDYKDDYRVMLNWVIGACVEEQTKQLNRDAAEARLKSAGARR